MCIRSTLHLNPLSLRQIKKGGEAGGGAAKDLFQILPVIVITFLLIAGGIGGRKVISWLLGLCSGLGHRTPPGCELHVWGQPFCERAYSNASSGPNCAESLPTEVNLGSLKPRAAQRSVLPSVKPSLQACMRWDQALIKTGQGTVSTLAMLQPARHLFTNISINISLVIPFVFMSFSLSSPCEAWSCTLTPRAMLCAQ